MSFEEKLAFGKAGESVVARYLRSRGNTVLPAPASLPDPEPPDTVTILPSHDPNAHRGAIRFFQRIATMRALHRTEQN